MNKYIPLLVTKELPTWLYNNLDEPNNSVSGIDSYWTATRNISNYMAAWSVNKLGDLVAGTSIFDSSSIGVRPVITVSKSNLN